MATLSERLAYLISLNSDEAVRGFQKVGTAADKELSKADEKTNRLNASLTKFGAAALASAGIAGAALYKFAQASDDATIAHDKLANTIANSSKLAGAQMSAFDELASSLQKTTVVEDDTTIAAMAMLGQFKLNQQQILEITPLVVDFSRKMGVDMVSAAKAVGKAVDGKATALQKAGITLDATALKTDAYRATVDGLRGAVGGFAEKEGATFTGKVAEFKNQLQDAEETIGAGVIPVFEKMFSIVEGGAHTFTSLPPAVQQSIGSVAAFGTVALAASGGVALLAGNVSKLGTALLTMNPYLMAAIALATAATIAFEGYESKQRQNTASTDQFVAALERQQAGHRGQVDALIASRLAATDYDVTLRQLGANGKDLADLIEGRMTPGARQLQAALEGMRDGTNQAGIASHELQSQSSSLATQIEVLQRQYTTAQQKVGGWTQSTNAAEHAMGTAANFTEALGQALRDLPKSTSIAVHVNTESAWAQIRSLAQAVDALTGRTTLGERIVNAVNQAKAARDDLAKDVGGGSGGGGGKSDLVAAQEKEAKDAAQVQEDAFRAYMEAISNKRDLEREIQDNEFEDGKIALADYVAILDERMSTEVQYTDAWMTIQRRKTQVLREETAKQKALLDQSKKDTEDSTKALEDHIAALEEQLRLARGGNPDAQNPVLLAQAQAMMDQMDADSRAQNAKIGNQVLMPDATVYVQMTGQYDPDKIVEAVQQHVQANAVLRIPGAIVTV